MAEPTIQLGGGNWAGKSDNLLGYYKEGERFYKQDFTFSRSTTGTYTDKDGYIQTSAINMPRVDYLNNSNGSLILEPQRTNLITNSNSNSLNFTFDNVSMTYNSIISPDGETNGILFEQTGSANSNSAYNYGLTTTDGTYSYSLFIKAKDSTKLRFYSSNGASTLVQDFNPLEMTEGILSGNLNLKFEDYGNGWFRVSFTRTLSSAAFHRLQIYPDRNNTQKGVYIFGLQVESGGNYATSYIPTSGSSVTRNQDTCSITNVADRIGQTEGTFYIETIPLASTTSFTERIMQFEASGPDFITFQRYGNSNIAFYGTDGSNSWTIQGLNLFVGGETIKIAGAYKDNDIVLYVNGVQIGTNNTANAPQVDRMWFANNANGSLAYSGSHKEVKFYNTRLSNSELATLTTL